MARGPRPGLQQSEITLMESSSPNIYYGNRGAVKPHSCCFVAVQKTTIKYIEGPIITYSCGCSLKGFLIEPITILFLKKKSLHLIIALIVAWKFRGVSSHALCPRQRLIWPSIRRISCTLSLSLAQYVCAAGIGQGGPEHMLFATPWRVLKD